MNTLQAPPLAASSNMRLHVPPTLPLSNDQFFDFCAANRDLCIERSATGDLVIITPAGGGTGARNFEIVGQLHAWARGNGTGRGFDSSTGFVLPNGATYSPDASWVALSRLATLTPAQKERFLPLCPDFVIELRSPSDSLQPLQDKMAEYIANGARLGWLIDPVGGNNTVYVYRPDTDVEELTQPDKVPGESVLPGFTLDFAAIWNPGF